MEVCSFVEVTMSPMSAKAAGLKIPIAAPDSASNMQKYENDLKKAAQKEWSNVVTLGDAETCGIVEEGALAFKEICQLQSNYYNILDSRHGPMVMIRPDTLVILLLSSNSNKYELDLLGDVMKKTKNVIAYSDKKLTKSFKGLLNVVFGEELSHIARGIPFILIPQMVSYYKALANGINPDNPDGLSSWIAL